MTFLSALQTWIDENHSAPWITHTISQSPYKTLEEPQSRGICSTTELNDNSIIGSLCHRITEGYRQIHPKQNHILTAGGFQTQDWNSKLPCSCQISNSVGICLRLPCAFVQLCRSSLTLNRLASRKPLHIRGHFSWCERSEERHADKGERASCCFIWEAEKAQVTLDSPCGFNMETGPVFSTSQVVYHELTRKIIIQFLALTLSLASPQLLVPLRCKGKELSWAVLILSNFPMQVVKKTMEKWMYP